MKRLLLSSVLVGFLAACASEPAKEEVKEPVAASAAAEPVAESAAPAAVEASAPVGEQEVAMPDSNSVFFPFDVDAVQAADRDTIQAHGAYLSKNSSAKVRVEGNADERGSSEYNLGLGQRRANNVRKALILAGAKESQIETVSFGEEKPRASGHDEESWAQNRRADIVYK
ncbi:MAG: peptidoglycan-associated lipoprotein Pal [Gammaproteobacteria bacterium]|nr:peptidoglycan-associated lipoprotein Pal [Gammaproteobacteria bacterium]MBU1776678.1 peptidoglycan-associated lipoprotein Pal [Gammaproteobacteria bacterium]MBU1968270.1 peptidoglycan-associated lipoprotein Pal [Gammaproteobacteria bacterium]